MSPSCRPKPIFGMVRRRSESDDKRAWHGRLRTQTRAKMAELVDFAFRAKAPKVDRKIIKGLPTTSADWY